MSLEEIKVTATLGFGAYGTVYSGRKARKVKGEDN